MFSNLKAAFYMFPYEQILLQFCKIIVLHNN